MPYYRILIWTKLRKAPYKGIRLISDPNINAVYNAMEALGREKYKKDFLDVEVQMLSKLCKAVQVYDKKEK